MTYTPEEIGVHLDVAAAAWGIFESREFNYEAEEWSCWHFETTGIRNHFSETMSEPVGLDPDDRVVIFRSWNSDDMALVPFDWFTDKDAYKKRVENDIAEQKRRLAEAAERRDAAEHAASEADDYQTYLTLKERFEGDRP